MGRYIDLFDVSCRRRCIDIVLKLSMYTTNVHISQFHFQKKTKKQKKTEKKSKNLDV